MVGNVFYFGCVCFVVLIVLWVFLVWLLGMLEMIVFVVGFIILIYVFLCQVINCLLIYIGCWMGIDMGDFCDLYVCFWWMYC